MNTTIAVSRNAAYFDGHFPGFPILPGVVELLLVLDALSQHGGQAVKLRGIAFARLRQLVFPGELLDLDTRELDNGHIRVELSRSNGPVASAELIPGDPETPGSNPIDVTDLVHPAPPLDALLTHRPPMRFVTSIVGESAQGLDCTASIPAACGLVRDGDVHVLAGVEAAAQTAAAWEAVRRWREGGVAAPRMGYLVALRDIVFFAAHLPGDRPFATSIRLEAAAPPLTHYRFEVSLGGAPLARGMIATFLAA